MTYLTNQELLDLARDPRDKARIKKLEAQLTAAEARIEELAALLQRGGDLMAESMARIAALEQELGEEKSAYVRECQTSRAAIAQVQALREGIAQIAGEIQQHVQIVRKMAGCDITPTQAGWAERLALLSASTAKEGP